MRLRITLSCLVLSAGILVSLVGCQRGEPGRTPLSQMQSGPPVCVEELVQRPLYTFNEWEVDAFLPVAREIEPSLPDRVVYLGRKNIGQPYDIYLLGEFPYELFDPDPIYCLSRSDCLVFSEHMYAMALSEDWWTFLRTLQRIRYRDGIIGMLTRNHYGIAGWNPNNGYLFEDMTTKLGGVDLCKPLTQTCRRARFFAQFGIGQDIPDQPVSDHYIPKENVPAIASALRNGDFVNIIRGDENSQWCGHTGLIAIADDGTPDFLHSARPKVREQPLVEYLTGDKRCVGIKILRLRANAEQIMADELASNQNITPVNEATLQAALSDLSYGSPDELPYGTDWLRAMRFQAYRLPPDAPVDADLQQALESIDADICAELGIAAEDRAFGVLDMTDLRLAWLRPDEMFYAASVPKICIALAYFAENPAAVENLDPQVAHELGLMIKRSDNEMAAKYGQLVGIDKVLELIQSKRYKFYDEEHGGGLWFGKHYSKAGERIGDPLHDHSHGATVRQVLRYYLMLEQGRLENAAVCARLKEIFASPELDFHDNRFVRALAGRDVQIIRKTGTWEDWRLDTARVQHGDRIYLLAGMTHHPRGNEYLEQMAGEIDTWLTSR